MTAIIVSVLAGLFTAAIVVLHFIWRLGRILRLRQILFHTRILERVARQILGRYVGRNQT